MTKEELKQEAEEYANKLLEGTEFEEDDMDVCAYTKRELLEAILYFAEPREKRITELEAQIEKMKRCENCKHNYDADQFISSNFCDDCFDYSKWEVK